MTIAPPRALALALGVALVACGAAPGPTAMSTPSSPPIAPASSSPVTIERIATFPAPGWHVPRLLQVAPDGGRITFLAEEGSDGEMALQAHDPRSGAREVLLRARDLVASGRAMTREEELRRERQRTQFHGITSYAWAARANVLLVPVGDRAFVRRQDGTIAPIDGEGVIDPKLSPEGTHVAFARGREVWLAEVGGAEHALTHGAPEGVTRGQSDFNMQEEFHEPSGLWWSPTGRALAYLEVDEREVAEVPILGFRGAPDLQLLRYPRAGAKNPRVRLALCDLEGNSRAIDLPSAPGIDPADGYLGRLAWSHDGKVLFLQQLGRDQRHLALTRVDVATGEARILRTHHDPAWTAMTELRPLADGSVLLVWPREGRHHLERVDGASGAPLQVLTRGPWDVFRLVGLDASGRALVLGNRDAVLERALYAVDLATETATRLSPEPGVHAIETSDPARGWVDVHSAHDRPPQVALFDGRGVRVGALDVAPDPEIATLRLRNPELVVVPATASAPALHGALLRPRDAAPGVRHPAIVVVYGGPAVQSVLDEYNPRLFWQHLADRGFVVLQVDNRGAAGYGHDFEAPIRERLGEVELEDQLRALDWLSAQPFVDGGRVGIYGHSYGGYMALNAMLRAPGRYKVGVAGSPVTDWSLYDSGYTERYMATPASNAAGYATTSLAPAAKNLAGKLLVIHALMDENVHFEHTARLLDAFVAADRDVDLLVFPGERHGYRSTAARRHVFRRVIDYFVANL